MVQEQVDAAVQAAEFAHSHRNLRISHKDLAYAIGSSKLPSTTLWQIRAALDAVLCVGELFADRSGQASAWDDDVARDCIRRLGGVPSPENVRRIVKLRMAAGWLRTEQ